MNRQKIIISSGDPAGCGPFIAIKAIQAQKNKKNIFYLVGDKAVFERFSGYKKIKNDIEFIDLGIDGIEKIKKGQLSESAGRASLRYLDMSLKVMKKEKIQRLVTAPLSKEAVKLSCKEFSGHTEYLAQYFKVKRIAMMMVSGRLKVALLTRHIPLRDVPKALSEKLLLDCLSLVHEGLQYTFKINAPKIVVASLNPHAGVTTFIDSEEKVIKSAIAKFKNPVYGPYPCDTLFTKEVLEKYDCIICAYHDQAMIPFKLLSFRLGVNLTLGLPIIRTSPAHGVAFDLIRKGKAPFFSSMVEAVKLASKLNP